MAFSGSQITRLGLYGGPRGLYGSFAGKTEAEVDQGAGAPTRKRWVIFPDNSRHYVTDEELRFLRAEYEAKVRQEGQATVTEKRRVKTKGRKRAKTRTFETPAEIQVSEGAAIPIPRSLIPEDKPEEVDVKGAVLRQIQQMRDQEEEAALLLLMVS